MTLDTLLKRVDEGQSGTREERLFESAAVLAGTMLMASGISGDGPEMHDSLTSLATLLPKIAAYRDQFYSQLLAAREDDHGKRLQEESVRLKQPFAGARQYLNQHLARSRAAQLQHAYLARMFAQMGYPDAANRQARIVPVASARMWSQIHCRITAAHQEIDAHDLDRAAEALPDLEDLLHRGIECGAFVDPWNILGFQGQFSIFRALENSVPDHRVDQLIRLMEHLFNLYARIHSEAAASGQSELADRLLGELQRLAAWWDGFASQHVTGLHSVSGAESSDSARHVGSALSQWHKAGTAAGDIAFWRKHVDYFDSPRAYALVVEALHQQRDQVASMALLMQWVSQTDNIGLADSDHSWHVLSRAWMAAVLGRDGCDEKADASLNEVSLDPERWKLCKKFFDYLEANADSFYRVPTFEGAPTRRRPIEDSPPEDGLDREHRDETSEEQDQLFGAAYEGVTFRDSAEDGFEGEIFDSGPGGDEELDQEMLRIFDRLELLSTVAQLWKMAAVASSQCEEIPGLREDVAETLCGWFRQAMSNRRALRELLDDVYHQPVSLIDDSHESMLQYDRLQRSRYRLLERILNTFVETADATRLILSALDRCEGVADELSAWERRAADVFRTLLRSDPQEARDKLPLLIEALQGESLLYVPLMKNGDPQSIVMAQALQKVLRDLLGALPRLGLITETCQLLATALDMEQQQRPGAGAVTEFDRLFHVGFRAIVEMLVESSPRADVVDESSTSESNHAEPGPSSEFLAEELIECLNAVTEPLLKQWLEHSRSLRLSVLEPVLSEKTWDRFVLFIQQYGHDIFSQGFFAPGNLRSILEQGCEDYLQRLAENDEAYESIQLLKDLDHEIPLDEAASWLQLVIETVIENYTEYRDYNNTTTQSDQGEQLYMLLDFLRLKVRYDRFAWQLVPIVTAHEVLVRSGRVVSAQRWRQIMAERTQEVVDWHLKRLHKLQDKYGMQLTTVSDRINERFVRPLELDALRALVRPAVENAQQGNTTNESFTQLEEGLTDFTEQPTGVGLDVPAWLSELEDEVVRATQPSSTLGALEANLLSCTREKLSPGAIRQQLEDWDESE
jgi:hypothetical protein